MKLLPLAFIFFASFLCNGIRDKFQPPPTSPPRNEAIDVTPTPTSVNKDIRSPGPSTGTPTPRTISGGVLNGKTTSLPQPDYPPAARAVRAGGTVSVQVLVDETGKVVSATAVGGHPLLRAAAEKAAREANFEPALLSGRPVKVSGILTYTFQP